MDENSADVTRKAWERMRYSQKKALLKNLGYHTSFAKTKSMTELVKRDGGHVAVGVHNLVKLWIKKNPDVKKINWL